MDATQEPIPVDALIATIQEYNPNCDQELIRKAYALGQDAHQGQYRKSGEPYFCHPVAVANLLTEIRMDDTTIVTALLHDVVEDTKYSREDIEREFGEQIADFVDGVTKLTNLELSETQSAEVENLRKLLMAMSKDIRVMLVKLADRLHNMRTIKSMKSEKQRKKARETMEIYAPLAGRMGMQYLREELEDLSFQVLNPQARASIMRKFIVLRGDGGDLLDLIRGDIEKALGAHNISAIVFGREKRPYSIWRKIRGKGEGFERLSDIYGFRIITDSVDACYRALGAMHSRYTAVPGRFKDYISQPKANGYRSLHTTVLGRDGKRVEIQIRTKKMNFVAESGVAAHWAYKDGVRVKNPYQVDPSEWLDDLSAGLVDHDDEEEFLAQFKSEMYSNQVFVFSPKGKVIRLPKGATGIDFAYAIHTDLGNHAVGALIDGQRLPLSTVLRNGQTVHVIRAEGSAPKEQWTQTAKTGRARNAIRRAFKSKERANAQILGYEIALAAFAQIDKKMSEKGLDSAARALGYKNSGNMLIALAKAELSSRTMIDALFPELANKVVDQAASVMLPPLIGSVPAYASRPGECCLPLPGDRIIGIARKGQGIVYHVIDCQSLAAFEEDQEANWIDLNWPEERSGASYPARIMVVMANDAGVLGRVCTLIGESHANIEQINFSEKRPDFYTILFEISVRDLQHLNNIQTAIETDIAIAEAKRYREQNKSVLEIIDEV